MTIVYLVRHAHAAWQTDEQRPLSARGTADAERIAALLAREPISAIYSSPARRAQQTVAPLAQRLVLPILIEVDLRERVLSAAPVDDFMTAIRACWDNPDRGLDGGESNQAAHRRGAKVKDIIENSFLADDHKKELCPICGEVRPDWVKTSTGYRNGGELD